MSVTKGKLIEDSTFNTISNGGVPKEGGFSNSCMWISINDYLTRYLNKKTTVTALRAKYDPGNKINPRHSSFDIDIPKAGHILHEIANDYDLLIYTMNVNPIESNSKIYRVLSTHGFKFGNGRHVVPIVSFGAHSELITDEIYHKRESLEIDNSSKDYGEVLRRRAALKQQLISGGITDQVQGKPYRPRIMSTFTEYVDKSGSKQQKAARKKLINMLPIDNYPQLEQLVYIERNIHQFKREIEITKDKIDDAKNPKKSDSELFIILKLRLRFAKTLSEVMKLENNILKSGTPPDATIQGKILQLKQNIQKIRAQLTKAEQGAVPPSQIPALELRIQELEANIKQIETGHTYRRLQQIKDDAIYALEVQYGIQ